MPQDSTGVVIAICGLAVVFTGLGALATYFVLRMARGLFLGGLINRLMGGTDMYASKESTVIVTPKSSRDLRAKVEELDFDEAVARYEGQGKPSRTKTASPPGPTPLADSPRTRGSRRGRGETDPDEQFDAVDSEDEDALG